MTFYAWTAYTGAVYFLGHATCSRSPRNIVIPGTFTPGVDIHDYWNNLGSLSKSDGHFLGVMLWQQHYTVPFLGHATRSRAPRNIVIPGTFGPGVDIHDY